MRVTHYCINIVCGKEGFGSGALIRVVHELRRFYLTGSVYVSKK